MEVAASCCSFGPNVVYDLTSVDASDSTTCWCFSSKKSASTTLLKASPIKRRPEPTRNCQIPNELWVKKWVCLKMGYIRKKWPWNSENDDKNQRIKWGTLLMNPHGHCMSLQLGEDEDFRLSFQPNIAIYMDVSWNVPLNQSKSSILIEFIPYKPSILGIPSILGNLHIYIYIYIIHSWTLVPWSKKFSFGIAECFWTFPSSCRDDITPYMNR